ncbi:MAG: Holliday junction resolvase RuvX [Alphaproteobacteria bacterium]|nr:Holliday junction resolvase RuvX [Alphaproteobacteria bacterium]
MSALPETIVDVPDLPKSVKPGLRLLGLDLGDKTIGLSISDPGFKVATPLETIRRKKFTADADALDGLIQHWGVGGLVFGLPVNMDGSEGPRCQSTRQFHRNLVKRGMMLPTAFWDERLSTSAVERLLVDEADMTRKRRGTVVDKMAAAFILQGALDALG